MKSEVLYKWLFDIRLWILALFLLRMDNITIPPLDEHGIRQTLTLSVARNMIEVSPDPLRPRVDFGDWDPRIVACEPPIYNSMIALMYLIFGEHDWFGRLINVTISSLGLWFLWAFLRKIWEDDRAALLSTVFYGVSLAFVYSRKAMPDTFALSFVFAGCYFGLLYLEEGRRRNAILYVLTMSVGLLCKVPMVCAASLLLIPFLNPDTSWQLRGRLVALSTIPLALTGWWYFYWHPHIIGKEGAFQMFETFGMYKGWELLFQERNNLWEVFFVDGQLMTWLALGMTLPGIFYLGVQREFRTALSLVLYTLLFTYFVVQAGYAYPTHDYYGIPYNVPLAMMAGYGLAHLLRPAPLLAFGYITIAAYYAISAQRKDFFIPEYARRWENLEKVADSFSKRTDKFSTNSGIDTRMFYHLHRKGIGHFSWDLKDHPEWTEDDIRRGGMKYMFIDKRDFQDSLPFPVIFDNGEFRAYRLELKE
jgi:4-amino-4-deoxy-L-arabinose transferase-like glycosyltransferase